MNSDDPWIRNPGHRLSMLEGRRAYVRLRCGLQPAESWSVDGHGAAPGCRWSLVGHPFDITEFRPAA